MKRRSARKKRQTDFFGISVPPIVKEKKEPSKLFTKELKPSNFTFMLNPEFLPVTAEEIIDSEYNNLLHNNLLCVLGIEYLERAPEWFVRKYNIYKTIRRIYNKDFTDPLYLENVIL